MIENKTPNISLERMSTSTMPFNQNFPFRNSIQPFSVLIAQANRLLHSRFKFSVFMFNTCMVHGVKVCCRYFTFHSKTNFVKFLLNFRLERQHHFHAFHFKCRNHHGKSFYSCATTTTTPSPSPPPL